ncbi:MAG: hypothetical protein ABSE48_14050 [Verrucomicrobiota bacterium]
MSMTQELWVIILSAFIVLIFWGIVTSKRDARRLKRASADLLPTLKQQFEPGRRYHVFLSHGQRFERVQILGISAPPDVGNRFLPFPLCELVILQRESGERIYVRPDSIRYYEEADAKAA